MAIPAEDQWQSEFPTPASADGWFRQLAKTWKPHRDKGLKTVISLPGVVDENTGKVYLSPNVRWLEQTDLAEGLRKIFGPDVVFKQEIRLLALGQLSAEAESGDFLLVDSGNGVGAAAVIGENSSPAEFPSAAKSDTSPCPVMSAGAGAARSAALKP